MAQHRDIGRYREIAEWLGERIADLTAPDLFLSGAPEDEDELILETQVFTMVGAARVLLEHMQKELLSQAESG